MTHSDLAYMEKVCRRGRHKLCMMRLNFQYYRVQYNPSLRSTQAPDDPVKNILFPEALFTPVLH